uniref:Phosphoglycolate phosphatase n=2 Tax=Phlebotomus papatasi TaxID=29031 RepID=A0A1B0GMX8_PHLPP
MYKQSATRLQSLPKEQIQAFIKSFDTVLTDCDGVIWLFNEALQGAPNVINRFLEMGKKVFFVTNNSTKTRDEFLVKAKSLNFNMTRDGIISTAYLAAQYLKHRQFTKTAYVVGSQGVIQELEAVGIKTIGYG